MTSLTGAMFLAIVAAAAILLLQPTEVLAQQNFDYSQQPIPIPFTRGDRYPNRPETDVCRPIFDHILRGSNRFTNELVFNNNPNVNFANNDARRMTSRMQSRLDRLEQIYNGQFTVLKAWTQFPDNQVADDLSLHYEGRTIRVRVHDQSRRSEFLTNAVQAAFDWVSYTNNNYVRLSVIPDNCENNVDVVFILDQSGSVGRTNHGLAILFILNVIQYFSISLDATRVGFVAYSRNSHIEFDLNDFTTAETLANRINNINYRGGSTATALALNDTAFLLNPSNNRGARANSKGIPKVAILITDGKSNRFPLTYAVPNLHNLGVQVYALGIANPDVVELQFIASDPDIDHVFLLNSYNDATGFVDFLSIQTCDTPAIVDPGDNTTTEVPEDGIRYFQVECDSFSNTVLVELFDNTGTSFLYCSAVEQNPGPLTSNTIVNNTVGINFRTCIVNLVNPNDRVVYIGVQGVDTVNQFTVVVWDLLFQPAEKEIIVLEGQTGVVYDVAQNLTSAANGITFQYLITEGNTGNMFRVNGNGRVSVPAPGLVFDDNSFYRLTIVAENVDDSCQRSRFRLDVRVGRNQITFANLQPASIAETASDGDSVTMVTATGGAGQIRYSILTSNVPFSIDSGTGLVSVDGMLNFEDEDRYEVLVEAESVGTIVSGSMTQVINVIDVNEQPEWITTCAQNGRCTASITENLPSRNIGNRLGVSDLDLPSLPNGMITYSITPTDLRTVFSVDNNGNVRTNGVLDRETRGMYTFTVTAADGGNPSLSVTTAFQVTVLDENDNAPVFVEGLQEISIPENEPVNTVITQYITTDEDTEPNSQVTYSMSPGSDQVPFQLNSDNGALSIIRTIDYEDLNSRRFQINISANNPPHTTTRRVRISITDLNDNAPVFDSGSYSFNVVEHSDTGTTVDTVNASDADSGANGDVRYGIVGGNSLRLFRIGSTTGVITVARDIDREQIGSVDLRVRAQDRGSPRLSSTVTVTITITDINDNPPIFNPDSYAVSLREDKAVDLTAFTVFATDADKPGTDNSRIVYSISGGNIGNAFRIDSSSGMVEVNNSLNHEDIPSYSLTIRADDQGSPQMSDTTTATVTIINVNEAPPTLSGDQEIDVSESIPTDVIIASFSASDADFTPVSISITAGNSEGKFAISNQGNISIEDSLDFETTTRYNLTIQASDGEQTDTAFLIVNVLDENEFNPVFIGPEEFSFDEELPSGTLIGTLMAEDSDGSAPNNVVTFSFMTQASVQDYLTLDSTSGEIRTAVVLDRERLTNIFPPPLSSLRVTLIARDGGSPSLQSSRQYTFTLRDINDNSPEFGADHYTNSIFENQPAQAVIVFSAVDDDLGSNAEIAYSFTVQPPIGQGMFDILNNAAEISSTGPLDCELQPEYNFTITATDMGSTSRSSTATATLTLRDENDNTPIFTESPYIRDVRENVFLNTVVATVTANDADKGSNGEVFYEIIEQDESEDVGETASFGLPFFVIDQLSGEIMHITPFNFETFRQVNITVKASDRGTPRRSSTTLVIFNVENVDESPPRFGSSCSSRITVTENTPADSVILNCTATDLDNTTTPDNSTWITYSITSGNTNNTFAIGLHTGIITNLINLDFEANNFFEIFIQALDGSFQSRRMRVRIFVEDENDNAPQFQTQMLNFAMTSEAIQANTQMIAMASATDIDTGMGGRVFYSIPENGVERVSPTETRVTIRAYDGGATPLASSTTLTVQFERECLLQKYTIDSSSGEVSVKVLCSVEIIPQNIEVVLGKDHAAQCRIVRNSPATYQWILNGSAIDLTTFLSDSDRQANLTISSVGFQDAGAYACKVTTEAGSLQTSTYTVNILIVPFITVPPQSDVVMEQGSVEFSCFAAGTPAPSIVWRFQERTVGTGNTLTIDNVDSSKEGNYSCVAVNTAGRTSQDTNLIVFVSDDVAIIVINSVDQASPDGTCHYLNPATIEALLSASGATTMITKISAESLCDIDSCNPNPCGNGGTCQLDQSSEGGYVCACTDGFTGVTCMEDVDECFDDPCGSLGVCTNVRGYFQCQCTDSTGNRCQYPNTCAVRDRCPEGRICMESPLAADGYACVEEDNEETLRVAGVLRDPGFLEDLLINLREALLQQQQLGNNRRRRATDDTLDNFAQTSCSPRFLRLDNDQFGLFWECPDGEESPSLDILPFLCEGLIQSGLVDSCRASNTSVFTRPTPPPLLPRISVTIEVIQVDGSGQPLSVGETIKNLERITEDITRSDIFSGAELGGVTAMNPIECPSGCVNGECTDRDVCTCNDGWMGDSCNEEANVTPANQESAGTPTGLIVGVVMGVVLVIVLVVVVVIVLVVVVSKSKEHKKRTALKKKYAEEMQDVESSSTLQPATELTYIPPHKSSTERLNSTPNNRSTEMLVDKSHSSVENNDYDELPTLAYKNTNSSS